MLAYSQAHKPGDRPRNKSLILRRARKYRGVTVSKAVAPYFFGAQFLSVLFQITP